jgi:mannose-6-phosphate isomerase
MQPVLVERVWGGDRIASLLGKPSAAGVRIGESWEVSDLPHGQSRVAEGPLAGRTLREVLEQHADAVLGQEAIDRGWGRRFGLLMKFIDATDRLSVQVHPGDAYAAAHHPGQSGKTECWVVMHAEPGAWLIHGLKAGVTREQVEAGLQRGAIEEYLAVRRVKAGDFFWVPAGRVHAIGPGILLAEVQQPSDLTYRLYDWNRAGLDGRPRPLHVREAMETARFAGDGSPAGGCGKTVDEAGLVLENLVDCPAFSLSRLRLDDRPWTAGTQEAVVAVMVLAGSAQLTTAEGSMPIHAGDTILVPADAGEYTLQQATRLTVLVAAPPGKAPR